MRLRPQLLRDEMVTWRPNDGIKTAIWVFFVFLGGATVIVVVAFRGDVMTWRPKRRYNPSFGPFHARCGSCKWWR